MDRKTFCKGGVQWKQGVVICVVLYTTLLYDTTPFHCTPDPLHPPLQSVQRRHKTMSSYQTTGTGTWKHLKSAFKSMFLLISLQSNVCKTFLGQGLEWSENCSHGTMHDHFHAGCLGSCQPLEAMRFAHLGTLMSCSTFLHVAPLMSCSIFLHVAHINYACAQPIPLHGREGPEKQARHDRVWHGIMT